MTGNPSKPRPRTELVLSDSLMASCVLSITAKHLMFRSTDGISAIKALKIVSFASRATGCRCPNRQTNDYRHHIPNRARAVRAEDASCLARLKRPSGLGDFTIQPAHFHRNYRRLHNSDIAHDKHDGMGHNRDGRRNADYTRERRAVHCLKT